MNILCPNCDKNDNLIEYYCELCILFESKRIDGYDCPCKNDLTKQYNVKCINCNYNYVVMMKIISPTNKRLKTFSDFRPLDSIKRRCIEN